ncbi:hypothetical protein SAMN05428937_1803 [Achromobacter sp. MFA1 R4]|nr:hypothetical protein SAMN05428937_1803 [Achromobacter sp. MFA1 R4]
MKPPHMQHFMSNCSIGKVSIGRSKKSNTLGVDVNCEFALTSSPAFILIRVENYVNFQTRTFLHLKDELLHWLTKTGKVFGLHMQTMRSI